MIKRLVFIGIYTGGAQLFSVFTLKYISSRYGFHELSALGPFDSLFQLILNLIAFGLQSSTMRDLAVQSNWVPVFRNTQRARLTFGLILTTGCLLAFNNPVYSIFVMAPLAALSGDYALYGLGFPVKGASMAFLRVAIPYSVLLFFGFFHYHGLIYGFLLSLILVYGFTNYLIAKFLKVNLFERPSLPSLTLYIKSLNLGFVGVSLYIIGLGLLLMVPLLYPSKVVSVSFIGLKFYVLFKGVLRIIHQSFVKEMTRDDVCLKVDQLSMIISLSYLGSIVIFPDSFIRLFFGPIYLEYRLFFLVLGIAAVIYSFMLSMGTRCMLDRRDRVYTILSIGAASSSILSLMIFSFFTKSAESVSFSVLAGELVFVAGFHFVLVHKYLFVKRLFFLGGCFFWLIIPLALRYLFGDNLIVYLLGIGCFGIVLLVFHRKKFDFAKHP